MKGFFMIDTSLPTNRQNQKTYPKKRKIFKQKPKLTVTAQLLKEFPNYALFTSLHKDAHEIERAGGFFFSVFYTYHPATPEALITELRNDLRRIILTPGRKDYVVARAARVLAALRGAEFLAFAKYVFSVGDLPREKQIARSARLREIVGKKKKVSVQVGEVVNNG
jgi:hypothetical protein